MRQFLKSGANFWHSRSLGDQWKRPLGWLFFTFLVGGIIWGSQPYLWPGGYGFGKEQSLTTTSSEKDKNGDITKSIETTKNDDGKTLWDLLSLIGVPLSLAVLGYWLQQRQQESAAEETREEILQGYFDRVSALLVDKNLRAIAAKVYAKAPQETGDRPQDQATEEERELLDSAVDVIRARTLSILRRFQNDSACKASVIRFLIEADITSKLRLSLSGADLSGAKLSGADLSGAKLSGADLSGADLSGADLSGANLFRANLSGANLSSADISADLFEANLSRANLSDANVSEAELHSADLEKISWSESTIWTDVKGLKRVKNMPAELKQQLGLD